MVDNVTKLTTEKAVTSYRLSHRAAETLIHGDHWKPIEQALLNVWNKQTNPGGMCVYHIYSATPVGKLITIAIE